VTDVVERSLVCAVIGPRHSPAPFLLLAQLHKIEENAAHARPRAQQGPSADSVATNLVAGGIAGLTTYSLLHGVQPFLSNLPTHPSLVTPGGGISTSLLPRPSAGAIPSAAVYFCGYEHAKQLLGLEEHSGQARSRDDSDVPAGTGEWHTYPVAIDGVHLRVSVEPYLGKANKP